MLLKIAIVFVFICVLLSLSSGFFFLLKDADADNSKRALYALGIRITLAALLMGLIGYGIASGKLGSTAPWDRHKPSAQSVK